MSITGSTAITIAAKQTGTTTLGTTPTWNGSISLQQSYTDGTTANKHDLFYVAERTVADGADDDLDLNAVLTDTFGNTISAVEMVELTVINEQSDATANTTDLTIGGDGSTGVAGFTTAVATIGPGGHYSYGCPDAGGIAAITASTADILRITNGSGAANTYQIAIRLRSE